MSVTPEELHWLAHDWSRLRGTMSKLITPLLEECFEELGASGRIGDACWERFMDRTLAALGPKAGGNDLYATGLAMFATPLPFRKTLEESLGRLSLDEGEPLRGSMVRRGLAALRGVLLTGSVDSDKTWGRIDRMSRELWKQAPDAEAQAFGGRCSADHMMKLVEQIRIHHPGHRTLPRTFKTMQKWFHRFCEDCGMASSDAFEGAAEDWVEAKDIEYLPEGHARVEFMYQCIDALPEEPQTFIRVHSKMTDPVEFSDSAYCERMKIDRTRFGRVLRTAKAAIGECIEKKEDNWLDLPGYASSWRTISLMQTHEDDEEEEA